MPIMTEKKYPAHVTPSSFDGNDTFQNENGWQKLSRKIREEPLIAIGSGLTVYALVAAARAVRRGDSASAQRMFRARVAAQGFTIIAIVAGGMYYSQDRSRNADLRKLEERRAAEEKRGKWLRELEARDEEDKALRARLLGKTAEGAAGDEDKEGGVLSALAPGSWGAGEGADSEAAEQGFGNENKLKRNPGSSMDALGAAVVGSDSTKD